MISWILSAIKFVTTLLGLYKQESELAAGRAEQRDADREAMEAGHKAAQEAQQDADQRHATDPTDEAFDKDFWREDK